MRGDYAAPHPPIWRRLTAAKGWKGPLAWPATNSWRRQPTSGERRYIATAHTADDQVETILFNFLRGTGLAGLAGIPRLRQLTAGAVLVRPLLNATRGDVLAYLNLLGQTYREDATNQSLDFTRNLIRHQLLPLLEEQFNPQVKAALRRLGSIAQEADELLEMQAGQLLDQIVRRIEGGVELHIQPLRAPPICSAAMPYAIYGGAKAGRYKT